MGAVRAGVAKRRGGDCVVGFEVEEYGGGEAGLVKCHYAQGVVERPRVGSDLALHRE